MWRQKRLFIQCVQEFGDISSSKQIEATATTKIFPFTENRTEEKNAKNHILISLVLFRFPLCFHSRGKFRLCNSKQWVCFQFVCGICGIYYFILKYHPYRNIFFIFYYLVSLCDTIFSLLFQLFPFCKLPKILLLIEMIKLYNQYTALDPPLSL